MSRSVYDINKGINAPLEFKGLKGQYIWYLGAGLVGILVLFVILYVVGVSTVICLGVTAGLGVWLFTWVYQTSARYGPHGLMKKGAWRLLPTAIKNNSRTVFFKRKR